MEKLFTEYENQLNDSVILFDEQVKEIKKSRSSKFADMLEEELHRINVSTNISDLRDIYKPIMDKIRDQYIEVVGYNKIVQKRQIAQIFDGAPIDNLESIKKTVIEYSETKIENMNKNLFEETMDYIKKYNKNPNIDKNKVEQIVKETIKSVSIKTSINEIEQIYAEVVNKMTQDRERFYNNYTNMKQNPSKTSNLRQEVKDGKLYTYDGDFIEKIEDLNELSPEGVFEDNYESENARRFK